MSSSIGFIAASASLIFSIFVIAFEEGEEAWLSTTLLSIQLLVSMLENFGNLSFTRTARPVTSADATALPESVLYELFIPVLEIS